MKKRYLVIDQNFLRKPELQHLLDNDPSARIVLTDAAFIEMTKNEYRKTTLKLSLSILSKHANRIIVSRAVGESLKFELENKKPVNDFMHHHEATKFVREILTGLANGTQNAQFQRLITDPEDHISGINEEFLNHKLNKERALQLLEVTKNKSDIGLNQKIRSGPATEQEYIKFIAEQVPFLYVSILSNHGFSNEKAKMLMSKKPMLLRYLYLKMWAVLKWEEQGRLESLSAEKVTNDLLDHDYILTATFFNGLLTNDNRAQKAYEALNKLLS